jgi:uncharacterized protein involved in outer membrane biogenesis
MKIIGNILLIVIILIASIYAGRNILIKNAVNSGGSSLLATNVNVDSVNFDPLGGSFQIKGLSVANPDGFSAGNALYLGEVSVKMNVKSLLTDTIMIEEIRIHQPEINIAGKPGDTNLTRLQKNIAGDGKSGSGSTTTEATTESGGGKGVAIRYLALQEGKISASFAGLAETPAVKLPSLEMHDIGTKDSSVGVKEAVQKIFVEVMKLSQRAALSGAGMGGQLENLKSDFSEKTDALKNDIKEKLKGFGF